MTYFSNIRIALLLLMAALVAPLTAQPQGSYKSTERGRQVQAIARQDCKLYKGEVITKG
jgi:hypothetical protein